MMPSSSTGWKRDFRACSSCELYKCNHEILHVQSQMYLSSHSPSGFCQQASSCAGLRKPSASLYLKQYSSVTIFRDVRVDFFFPPKQSLRVPHRVLTVLFLMSLQLSLPQDDSRCFLNAYVWMSIVESLATASHRTAHAGWGTADA